MHFPVAEPQSLYTIVLKPLALPRPIVSWIMLDSLAILDLVPCGIVIINSRRKVIAMNAVAEGMIREGNPFAIRNGILVAQAATYDRALSEALEVAFGRFRGRTAFSIARKGLKPISVACGSFSGTSATKSFILIADPMQPIRTEAGLLR